MSDGYYFLWMYACVSVYNGSSSPFTQPMFNILQHSTIIVDVLVYGSLSIGFQLFQSALLLHHLPRPVSGGQCSTSQLQSVTARGHTHWRQWDTGVFHHWKVNWRSGKSISFLSFSDFLLFSSHSFLTLYLPYPSLLCHTLPILRTLLPSFLSSMYVSFAHSLPSPTCMCILVHQPHLYRPTRRRRLSTPHAVILDTAMWRRTEHAPLILTTHTYWGLIQTTDMYTLM